MESAFGIDHGYDEEFEKALPGFGAVGGFLARKTVQAGSALRSGGMKAMGAAQPGRGKRMAGPGQLNKPMNALGSAAVGGGGRLSAMGGKMMKRPGLTGGLAVGGAGAVGGGAAYGNRKKF